jgi:hypothetical protein
LVVPSISQQPTNEVTSFGTSNIVFTVSASGSQPLFFQWMLNGTNIGGPNYSGVNSDVLVLDKVALTNIGAYSVTIANLAGSITSSNAMLAMSPYLSGPFTGQVDVWGETNALSVEAWGSGTLLYQWYFNGEAIPGATNSDYILDGVQFTNAGLYSVVVTSDYGSVTNTPYQLVVNPANVSLGLYPGLAISGTVGYTYTIQASANLADPNAWVTMTNITLTSPIEIWNDNTTDAALASNPKKFYRVIPGQ